MPEKDNLALDLIVGNGRIEPADQARFDQWRAALPKPLSADAHFAIENGKLRIAVPLPESVALADPYFYPQTRDAVTYAAAQQVSRSGDMLIIETLPGSVPGKEIEGVLAIGPGNGLSLKAVPGPVPSGGESIAGGAGALALLATFGAALLGGLLLNIMPCVFPILSLKALSLARSGESQHDARREALAYAAGVIIVCLALGGALLLLRAGGEALGWAFQLQDPRVILTLMLLVTVIGFNLAGLFELPVLGAGEGAGAIGRRGGGILDRRTRSLHRDALHRAIHGGRAWCCTGAAGNRGDGDLLRAGAGAGTSFPVAWFHTRAPQDVAEARRVDGYVSSHIGSADVRDGVGGSRGSWGVKPGSMRWRSGSGLCCCWLPDCGGRVTASHAERVQPGCLR